MATGGTSARAKPFPLVRIVAADNSANAIAGPQEGDSMYRAHIRTAQKLSSATSISEMSARENDCTREIQTNSRAAAKPASHDPNARDTTAYKVAPSRAVVVSIRHSTDV